MSLEERARELAKECVYAGHGWRSLAPSTNQSRVSKLAVKILAALREVREQAFDTCEGIAHKRLMEDSQ